MASSVHRQEGHVVDRLGLTKGGTVTRVFGVTIALTLEFARTCPAGILQALLSGKTSVNRFLGNEAKTSLDRSEHITIIVKIPCPDQCPNLSVVQDLLEIRQLGPSVIARVVEALVRCVGA